MNRKRVLMDMNMTARWCRNGVMVGIVRVACEMFRSLQKFTEVYMVQFVKTEGAEEPEIHVIDPETYEITDKIIKPTHDDLFLMPEIQIRGIHVAMDYPWPGYLAKYGVERCALIHDILPIEMPEYFELETAQRMPEYVLGLFQNYNQIICVSGSVLDSVKRFREEGEIVPFCLDSETLSDVYSSEVFRRGWLREGTVVKADGSADIGFFTNIVTPMVFQLFVLNSIGNIRVIVNGYDVGTITTGDSRTEQFIVPAEALTENGYQEINLVSIEEQGQIELEGIRVFSTDSENIPVCSNTREPVWLAYVHEGVKAQRDNAAKKTDEKLGAFFCHVGEEKSFLMIGTIEPRKGHELVLDTFEKLWSEGKNDKLCIIGRAGWNSETLMIRLNSHPERDRRLMVIEGASDETLRQAYQSADALIQASAGEGFGLPLIEAGEYGKPILCSDIPVFHEVGGECALYFNRSLEGLQQCIRVFKDLYEKRALPDSSRISSRSWDDFSNECYQLMSGQRQWPIILQPGNHDKRVLKKVAVVTTYTVYPPMNGGQSRVFGLYKNLARDYRVELICMAPHSAVKKRRMIAPNLIENIIPMSENNEKQGAWFETKAGASASDMSVLLYVEEDSEYASTIREIGQDAEWIVSCHPYAYPIIRKVLPAKKIIYEAQDVEYCIKKEMYQMNRETEEALKNLFEAEKDCCEDSTIIMTCSDADKQKLSELYGTEQSKIIVVANGVDTDEIVYVNTEERQENKRKNGLDAEKIGIFMGAYHEPNLEAARVLLGIADQIKDAKLFLMGSQCNYFKDQKLPSNIALLGLVTEEEKRRIFSMVDFALNPMTSGSGTNVKMFDYMASGVPVITTVFGSRGIDNKSVFIITENKELSKAINEFDLSSLGEMVEEARLYTEKNFDWKVISNVLLEKMKEAE